MLHDSFRLKAFAYLEQIGVQFVLSDRVSKVEHNTVVPSFFFSFRNANFPLLAVFLFSIVSFSHNSLFVVCLGLFEFRKRDFL
jgi:hypothetical protein